MAEVNAQIRCAAGGKTDWPCQLLPQKFTLTIRRMFDWAGLELGVAYGDILLPPAEYGPDCHRQMIVVGKRVESV